MKGALREMLAWLAIATLIWIGCALTARGAQATVAEHAAYAVDIPGQGGSGVGIHDQLIVTNAHVVVRTGTFAKCCNARQSLRGEVVAHDPVADVALIYVASGDVQWLKIAPQAPQVGEPAWFLGFGTWRYLSPRSGHITSQTKYQVADGVYVWKLSAHSASGDSGSGVINQQGEVVALVWGNDNEGAAMLPGSLVSGAVQRWATQCMKARAVDFAGCWGGCSGAQCPTPGTRPVYPARPPQQQPPPVHVPQPTVPQPTVPQPTVPAPPPVPATPAEPRNPQVCIPLDQVGQWIAKDERFRGPAGKDGSPGPAGKDAAVDYDRLAKEVLARLPPLQVEAYDQNGAIIDRESYPFPGPIRLRYGQAK